MAWDTKYIAEFTDILGLGWKIEIEDETAHVGDPVEMQLSGNPLTIDFLTNSDHVFDSPIKGSKIDFTVESTNFQYVDFYTVEDLKYRVSVYHSDTTLYWRGYILTDNYSEPYDSEKFSVTISASDGLGYLKNYLYKYQTVDPDDTYYNGRRLESQVILDILGKIGVTSFREYINIYEESMDTTVNDSPMDQVKIDVDIFRDMYCYDVLNEILKKYNAVIRQKDGVFYIYRPVELAGATVYGRIFTGATTKTSTSFIPAQFISRTGAITDIRDVNGGTLMIQAPAKVITLYQNYGYKLSWIDNWEFKGVTFNESDNKFENWTYTGGGVAPVLHTLKGESDGIVLSATTGGPGANPILYQSFGEFAIDTTDIFIIEFEYFYASLIDAQNISFAVRIKADGSSHYLYPYDDYEAKWNAGADYLDFTEAVAAAEVTEWRTFKRTITGIPTAGSYTIGLYNGTSSVSNAFWGIKNIQFYSTSDKLSIKRTPKPSWFSYVWLGKIQAEAREAARHPRVIDYKDVAEIVLREYTSLNSLVGTIREYDFILGDVTDANVDNVLEQLAGALAITQLNNRVDTVTLDSGTLGTIEIECNGIAKRVDFISSLADTAEEFVTLWGGSGGDYYLSGVQISFSGADIIFTGLAKGFDFSEDTTATTISGDIHGTVVETTPSEQDLEYTTDWNTYFKGGHSSGSESKELLAIIADEIANQYSRPRQFLNLPILENNRLSNLPSINIVGNLQDSKNKVGGNNRIFIFNRIEFNVRDREWNVDLSEII